MGTTDGLPSADDCEQLKERASPAQKASGELVAVVRGLSIIGACATRNSGGEAVPLSTHTRKPRIAIVKTGERWIHQLNGYGWRRWCEAHKGEFPCQASMVSLASSDASSFVVATTLMYSSSLK